MAISIDWVTRVIFVPQTYPTLIGGTIYELDTDQYRKDIGAIMASEDGMPFPDAHEHIAGYTVAGITYSRKVEILNPYSNEFEDGQYTIVLKESNNNIFDVENGFLVQNQVQVIPTNSAGLQVVSIGSGLSPAEQQQLQDIFDTVDTKLLTKALWLALKK
jgi:hypothetical protein